VKTDPFHFLFFASRVENGVAILDKEESRHVFSVLRNSHGKTIMVTDGGGVLYECTACGCGSDETACPIVRKIPQDPPLKSVGACIGIQEKDEFERMCGDLAAIGVTTITPLVCGCCQKPWWQAWDKHAPRIKRKMIAGIKQARSLWLPQVLPPEPFSAVLDECTGSLVLAADETGERFFGISGWVKNSGAVSFFVGPPGGFSADETEALAAAGAVPVSLSENRLRTELAAVVLCGMIKAS
jgi:16S rRNA (uracil1498-N3)-methyltransferase